MKNMIEVDGLFNSHRLQYGDYQNPDNPDDNLEYHWWYQTETGVWAQKNGGGASSLMTGVTNPGTYVWFNDPAVIEGAVKYYAVEADIAY